MQAAFAALPEFPLVGRQAVAAPVRRAWRVQQVFGTVFGGIHDQHAAAVDDLALRRGPGTDAGIQRAAGKVGVAFLGVHLLHAAFDADHALQLRPEELQGGKRIAGQLPAFAAVVVAVPDNAARIKTLEQHHARAGPQIAAHGANRHGVGFIYFGLEGFVEPLLKLLQGIVVRRRFVKFGTFVAAAQRGKVRRRKGHGLESEENTKGDRRGRCVALRGWRVMVKYRTCRCGRFNGDRVACRVNRAALHLRTYRCSGLISE